MQGSIVRFLHLADLHLTPCPCGGGCGPYQPACHACIKAAILERLQRRISSPATRPDLVLIAGDLTERRDGKGSLRTTAAPLDAFVQAAKAQGSTVVGITGEHDGLDSTLELRKALGWDWLLRSGEVNRSTGVAVHGIEGRPNRAGVAHDLGKLRRADSEPSILLVHDELRTVRAAGGMPFDYYAMGHLHRGRIKTLDRNSRAVAGYPGHLFSYWDGDGKSWPVHVIEGTISNDGTVKAELVPLSREAEVPETRRMYVDCSDAGRSSGTIVFENSPGSSFFTDATIQAELEDQSDGGVVYRRIARLPYSSREQMQDLLRSVLERLPGDVFVTPSTGGGWTDRLTDYGSTIARRRFPEFVTKTFKKSANTQ